MLDRVFITFFEGKIEINTYNYIVNLMPTQIAQPWTFTPPTFSFESNPLIQAIGVAERNGRIAGDGNRPGVTLRSHINSRDFVYFELTPDLSESGQTVYVEESSIRQPASVLIYMGSPSRTWSLTARFLARTPAEAESTFKSISLIKSWRMPGGGGSDTNSPPHILHLTAYSKNVRGVPMVLQGYDSQLPADVDYISTMYGLVPIFQTITLSLKEAQLTENIDRLGNFNLDQFKRGILDQW